ncbi:hypothetical protein [Amycolatopsis sp. H20-H5]|nr:hypothetical protein [Amycolatopsis sp. H20-H5]MEC3981795.1 hypothetical protein [Amycolatopsis sp. H20-H5]
MGDPAAHDHGRHDEGHGVAITLLTLTPTASPQTWQRSCAGADATLG